MLLPGQLNCRLNIGYDNRPKGVTVMDENLATVSQTKCAGTFEWAMYSCDVIRSTCLPRFGFSYKRPH